jgi:hypothetical protein
MGRGEAPHRAAKGVMGPRLRVTLAQRRGYVLHEGVQRRHVALVEAFSVVRVGPCPSTF